MAIVKLIAVFLLSYIISSCTGGKCEYPVYFQISDLDARQKLEVSIEQGEVSEEYSFDNGFSRDFDRKLEVE